MSGQLRLKRPFYDGLRQLLQKTVLSSYVLRRLARRKQLVDQILLLLHTISCLSGMIVYTKLFTPSGTIEFFVTPVDIRTVSCGEPRRREPDRERHSSWQQYGNDRGYRSEEHTSELQSLRHLVCRLLLE